MFRRLLSALRVLRSRRDFEHGMAEELRFHIDEYAGDLIRSGVPSEEAHRRARLELGGLNSVEENCREARALHVFDEIGRNLRYAARLLRNAPAFTLTAHSHQSRSVSAPTSPSSPSSMPSSCVLCHFPKRIGL